MGALATLTLCLTAPLGAQAQSAADLAQVLSAMKSLEVDSLSTSVGNSLMLQR